MLSRYTANPSPTRSPDKDEFYVCEICGEKVWRILAEIKSLDICRYVFPSCKCKTEKLDQDVDRLAQAKMKSEIERTFRHSIMNDSLKQATFENFEQREGTELMFKTCLDYVKDFDTKQHGLLGYGEPGNGKSHLFAAIHHELEKQDYICLFLDMSQLFSTIESSKKWTNKLSMNDVITSAIRVDLLTLDELGAGSLTQEQFMDVLFPILNGRQGKKTNFTTNLDLDQLQGWFSTDKYGKPLDNHGRMIDRILGGCEIIKNSGNSYRKMKALERMKL